MKKRILALMLALILSISFAAVVRADSSVEVMVAVDPTLSAESCAEFVEERLYDTELLAVYDTLLNGFALRINENMLLLLASFDFVKEISISGSYTMSESYEKYNSSALMVGIDSAREAGLRGSGVTVAVIDSGFDTAHPAFSEIDNGTLTVENMQGLFEDFKLLPPRQNYDPEEIYISTKIPFAYDYADYDNDVFSDSNHGTHVAGIIGASATDEGSMEGIVPDCQLILMKVFKDNAATAANHVIVSALEDAVKLGADVINLSIGLYSGSTESELITGMDSILKKAEEAGTIVVCSAGNESTSTARGASNRNGVPLPYTHYTDYGTISYPAATRSAFAVGSVENKYVYGEYFLHDENPIYYSDTNLSMEVIDKSFSEYFDSSTLEYVVVPGIGKAEDYTGLDVENKLALVSRGETTFVEKANIAAEHGALGIIVYNNIENESLNLELTGALIPAIAISKADGEKLALSETKELTFDVDFTMIESDKNAGKLSSFSSVGATPSLNLKPDICAVGGNVYSTVSDGYAGLSGTSMAAPQISGISALLIEKLEKDGETPPSERAALIRRTLMNSASLILQENGVEYSPRFQGAGLVNIDKALNSELSITYSPNGLPKAEFYDGIGNSFTLEVMLENLTDSPLSLKLGTTLTTDGYKQHETEGKTSYFSTISAEPDTKSIISTDNSAKLNRYSDEYFPSLLTLDVGEKRQLSLSFTLNEDYHSELDKIFTNGHFVEGFIICETEKQSYQLPYLGYLGDWGAAPLIDADIYHGDSRLFNGSSIVSIDSDNLIILGKNNFASEDDDMDEEIYSTDKIAFSPNGDLNVDEIYLRADFLRNVKSGELSVTNESGIEVYRQSLGEYVTKCAGVDSPFRVLFKWNGGDGYKKNFRFDDGLYNLNFTFTADYKTDITQKLTLPIVLDTEKPELVSASAEGSKLTVKATDNHLLQYIKVYEASDDGFSSLIPCDSADFSAEFELSGVSGDKLYVEILDQAHNLSVDVIYLSKLDRTNN